jgi:HD-GYP domain-containing protein (c-di-GMP phosphodiesterase class II)
LRIVTIDELTDEMVLAREIIDCETGRVLLGKGSTSLQHYNLRLRNLGIKWLYVDDSVSADIEIVPAAREEISTQAAATLQEIFTTLHLDRHPEYMAMMQLTQELIRTILANREVLINVYELRSRGGDFFGHSVNVAFMSLLIGQSLQYEESKLRTLGVGALLHDIGVVGLPADLLKWRREFTLDEKLLYEQHPVLGYHSVKDSWEISPLARGIILSHHERSDGSGYPRRLLRGDIHEFSRIVGLADCFEELAGGHPLSQEMHIQEAVELLLAESANWFETELVRAFTNRIPLCPTGSTVQLNDGRSAVVVSQNKGFPTRPIVRVFRDADGNVVTPATDIDLLTHNHLLIQ